LGSVSDETFGSINTLQAKKSWKHGRIPALDGVYVGGRRRLQGWEWCLYCGVLGDRRFVAYILCVGLVLNSWLQQACIVVAVAGRGCVWVSTVAAWGGCIYLQFRSCLFLRTRLIEYYRRS
jgi:hypothetical protein